MCIIKTKISNTNKVEKREAEAIGDAQTVWWAIARSPDPFSAQVGVRLGVKQCFESDAKATCEI